MRISSSLSALVLSLAVATAFAQEPVWPTAANPHPTVPSLATQPAAAPAFKYSDIKKEPLFDVTTPHGELLLPLGSSAAGAAGYILNVADGKLHTLPDVPKDKLIQTLQTGHTGDVLFSANFGLWVISGKVADMGSRYYADFPNSDLPAPQTLPADPKNPNSLPGTINPVEEGHMYLLATTDGHYAAIRVLEKETDGILIQYIYQPGNSINFNQPVHNLLPIHTPQITTISVVGDLGPKPAPTTLDPVPHITDLGGPAPATVLPKPDSSPMDRVLEPTLSSNLLQRQRLIQSRLEILANISTTPEAIQRKCDAIDQLGLLGLPPVDGDNKPLGVAPAPQLATKVVQALIDNITILNPQASKLPFSVANYYPAVGALRQIGKPASLAAVESIGILNPSDPAGTDPLKGYDFKLRLYSLVITGVEGAEVGDILLTRAKERADSTHKPLFDKAIKYLSIP